MDEMSDDENAAVPVEQFTLNIGQNRTSEPWHFQVGNYLPLLIHKDLRKFHCVVSLTLN